MANVPSDELSAQESSFLSEMHSEVKKGNLFTQNGVLRVVRELSGEKYKGMFDKTVLDSDTKLVSRLASLQSRAIRKIATKGDKRENLAQIKIFHAIIGESSAVAGHFQASRTGPSTRSKDPDVSEPQSPPPVAHSLHPRDLVEEFQSRDRSDDIIATLPWLNQAMEIRGYVSDEKTHETDQEHLLELVEEHNRVFGDRECGNVYDPAGVVERLDIEKTGEICVRADIHGDLATLLEHIKLLQREGLIDKNYKCSPNVHLIFLGDYMDRGANDIEVMSLLLSLHLENPNSVHLIRGNHEDINMSLRDSREKEWLGKHVDVFSELFSRLPLAICAQVPGEKDPRRVLFSHGLFPVHLDLNPLFQEGSASYLAIPKYPWVPKRTAPDEPEDALAKISREIPCSAYEGFAWSEAREVVEKILLQRGAGSGLSPEIINLWQQKMGIIQTVTGHVHIVGETTILTPEGNKVLVTTLPGATIDGMLRKTVGIGRQIVQGLFLAPSEDEDDNWEKRPIVEIGGELYPYEKTGLITEPML